MDDQNRIIAGLILSCKPEDLKGIAQKDDGSLAVVAPNGMKFVFSPVELDNARDSFCLPNASTRSANENAMAEPASVPRGVPCRACIEANGHELTAPYTSTGSVNGSPLDESVEVRTHGAPNPPASTSSAHETSRRRRKEKRQ